MAKTLLGVFQGDWRGYAVSLYFSRSTPFRIGETMSNGDSLKQRGTALENQFFADLDAKLLEELKAKVGAEQTSTEISRISGIKEPKVLEGISKLGVTAQSLAAMRVFPMVAVAWADGTVDESESSTIHSLAANHFLKGTSPASDLLKSWLETKPSSDLLAAWESYAKALVESLSAEEAEALRETIVSEIKTVASASGGLLGWASVSQGEHAVMNRIIAALTRA
jgi:uncharacterized tellurite resistance protein B-like protein